MSLGKPHTDQAEVSEQGTVNTAVCAQGLPQKTTGCTHQDTKVVFHALSTYKG